MRPQWFLVTEKVLLISYYSVERVENTVQDLKKEFEEQKILVCFAISRCTVYEIIYNAKNH